MVHEMHKKSVEGTRIVLSHAYFNQKVLLLLKFGFL